MAKSGPATPDSPSPAYCELVLGGDEDFCRGLVLGLQIGACTEDASLIGLEEELAEGGLGVHLRELLGGKGRLTHLVVSAALAARTQAAAPRLEAEARLRVVAVKPLRGGRCAFSCQAFTRGHAEELRGVLAALPAGVTVADYTEKERVDKEAGGVEAYTPVHEYELKAEGLLTGRIDALLAARRQLEAHALFSVERIELDLA
jgi:hypothetical protein